ncbi:S8 family serine peptidase [Spirulina sp. CS-785/01]|uniref:S8 family serine peptidase n=1 Tax=Spirulina sp. CS-785/01 TaxID=3021716 RepID=UPI00232DFA59|nr:S8 family serine peptidase [Spirulina sp. CS-785/01]MDB9314021.1 S8 family serine peptidase [Spirulina sp. CS-785/01]
MSPVIASDGQGSEPLPPKIYGEAIARSCSGVSLLSTGELVTQENVAQFESDATTLEKARERLEAKGFEVLSVGPFSLSLAGSPEVYQQGFKTKLVHLERPVIKEIATPSTALFIDAVETKQFGKINTFETEFEEVLEGVAINEPIYYFQRGIPSAFPPPVEAKYLQLPDDLVTGLNAASVHQQGIRGQGIRVVMVDTGWYRHPYFEQQNYRGQVVLAPGSEHGEEDLHGHGTGESANLLAIAPEIQFTMVKADVAIEGKSRNVNSIAALKTAISLNPDLISCSWGSDLRHDQLSAYDRILGATVADAVRRGIIMVCAAGNGHWGFPAQHRDTIAVGGVYRYQSGEKQGQLEASDYASGFVSAVYPQRQVPDVCGLVGKQPTGAYLMLPVAPGSNSDRNHANLGDQTRPNDGWAAFSGTSAAAPQVAGLCGLMKQVNPSLSPVEVREILRQTARDVQFGHCNPAASSAQARWGVDVATGFGLVDVQRAIAFLQGSGKIQPLQTLKFKRTKTMSDYPKLRENLEEIQWEIDKLLQTKFKDVIENVELTISEGNFSQRSPITRMTYSLRESLDDVLTKNLEITSDHIAAAQALIKLGRYQSTSLEVLTRAITHSNVKKEAIEALANSGAEISSFDALSKADTVTDFANYNQSLLFSPEFCGPKGKCYKRGDNKYNFHPTNNGDIIPNLTKDECEKKAGTTIQCSD